MESTTLEGRTLDHNMLSCTFLAFSSGNQPFLGGKAINRGLNVTFSGDLESFWII